jgi:hypothetical protein
VEQKTEVGMVGAGGGAAGDVDSSELWDPEDAPERPELLEPDDADADGT